MTLEIRSEDANQLTAYAGVSIAFEVDRICDVTPHGGDGPFELRERPLAAPYRKDYDKAPGNHPRDWSRRFDLSNWIVLAAYLAQERVAGALLAFSTPGLDMLEGRSDLAVLWDLRVAPQMRGHGIGSELFATAAISSRERECRQLKVETQNVNVPACRFYARQGCRLSTVQRNAYPEHPDEVQLLWVLDL